MENTKTLTKEKLGDLMELLKENGFREEFVDALNDDIDIPLLREKTEAKIFKKIYNALLKHVEKAVEKLE